MQAIALTLPQWARMPGWRWFLGIDSIPADATDITLSWQHPMPAWAVVCCAIGAGFVAWFTYRRLLASPRTAVALASVRVILLMALVACLAGPQWTHSVQELERDCVVVLVDRSRSMQVADGPMSRDESVRALLDDPAWSRLSDERHVEWIGFHGTPVPFDPRDPGPAEGWATDIGGALTAAQRSAAGRPLAGIVLISDGRTQRPVQRETLRELQSRSTPVFTIAVGSDGPVSDIAVTDAEGPARAFVRDQVPVTAVVQVRGSPPEGAIVVEMVDLDSGRVLDSRTVTPGELVGGRIETTLVSSPTDAGRARWSVRVRPFDADAPRDLSPGNDERRVDVELVDRPLRVLYIEGYPRWEYRYLKNMLVREPSVEASVMLLSADRDFAQEGNAPLYRLPQTREEFNAYDLVILGDVPSGALSPTQVLEIAAAVSERGAGLMWLAGERSTPLSWRGTALEDLVPIRIGASVERIDEPVGLEPTPAAKRAGVMRLGDGSSEWPTSLSELEWVQRIEPGQLKPATEVLARAVGTAGGAGWPAVLSMRFGSGQVIYVGTDETWRWRRGVGETYQERFWLQLLRFLARHSVDAGGRSAVLETDARMVEVARGTVVRLAVTDTRVAEAVGDGAVEARAERIDGGAAQVIQLRRSSGAGDAVWAATWAPDEPGAWRIRVDDGRVGQAETVIESVRGDLESADPSADHAQLLAIAESTGGMALRANALDAMPDLIPRRTSDTARSTLDPLTRSPAALSVILLLLACEWIGRRAVRLA
jgi:uncharacterized membrane protein